MTDAGEVFPGDASVGASIPHDGIFFLAARFEGVVVDSWDGRREPVTEMIKGQNGTRAAKNAVQAVRSFRDPGLSPPPNLGL